MGGAHRRKCSRFQTLSGEPLNTGKLVGCVSSSLPAAAQQQHLYNSEQHNAQLLRYDVPSELGPGLDWTDLLWKEHVKIVVKPNTHA